MSTNINFSVNPINTPGGMCYEVYASCGSIWDTHILTDTDELHRKEAREFADEFARREDVKDSDYFLDLSGSEGHEPCNIDKLIDEAVSNSQHITYEDVTHNDGDER